jgi:hypothetical protein
MTRSPDSLVPSASGQLEGEKRDDKALTCRREGEANLRAATEVNAVSASSYPPAITPTQLDLFPGRACPLEAKPVMDRNAARVNPVRRDGVEGGGTQRQRISTTAGTVCRGRSACGKRYPPERPCSVRRRQLRPVGRRIRAKPESAGSMPSRESEVAVVPVNLGKTEGREGPLLPLRVQRWERQPDCPREGRLNPGPIKPSAKRPRD